MKFKKINTELPAIVTGFSMIPGFATLGIINDFKTFIRAKKNLFKKLGIKSFRIHLSCHEGFITLSGLVDSSKDLKQVIKILNHTSGVIDIKSNNLSCL